MFVVLEGIDGAGCGEQRKALERLGKIGKTPIFTLKYPHYKDTVGQLIHDFLHEKYDFSVGAQFLLYAFQMVAEKEKIAHLRQRGILISDRYFTTTLCFQGVKGFPLQNGLEFAKIFKIEVPDLIVFLDVEPKVAFERKVKERDRQTSDRHEKDLKLMQKADSMYRRFIENHIFAPWMRVDGEKPVGEVTSKIVEIVKGESKSKRKSSF